MANRQDWLVWREGRNGGGSWYLRVAVPPELRQIVGRWEFKKSLKTADKKEARKKFRIEVVKVEQELADARRRLEAQPRSIADYAEDDLQRLVLLWFEDAERRSAEAHSPVMGANEFGDTVENAELEVAALQDPDNPNALIAVQSTADGILAGQGFPTKPADVPDGPIKPLVPRRVADVDTSSPQYRRLCEIVHRAMLERARRAGSLLRGEPLGVAYDPLFARQHATATVTAVAEQEAASPTLRAVLDMWVAERKPPEKTAREWRAAVRRFGEVNGELPVASITKGHVRAFKDALLKMPAALPHKVRELTVPEIIKATAKDDRPRLTPAAVKKHLGAVSSVLSWADRNGYREGNPASGVTVAEAKHAREKRLPYSVDDLQVIFGSLGRFRNSKPARFWVPLLALYTGARIEELGQLEVGDVRHQDGTDFLDINAEGGKRTKTKSSARRVPLHPELVRLGFLDYVADRRARGDKVVFPDLKRDGLGYMTTSLSKWYGRHARDLGITDKRKVFHSFRHAFKDACRAAKIEEAVFDALQGHTSGTVSRSYGSGYPLSVLADAVAKVKYDGLDPWQLRPD